MRLPIIPASSRALPTILCILGLLMLNMPMPASAATDPYLRVVPSYNWHTVYGGSWIDYSTSMARDSSGNLYVVSNTYHGWSGVSIAPLHDYTPPGPSVTRTTNVVIAKFSSAGQLLWFTYYGTGQGYTTGKKILLDASGNLYIVGSSQGNWDGLAPLRAYHEPVSGSPASDIFILKLKNTGEYLWHTYYGSSKVEQASVAAFNSAGKLVIAGYTDSAWPGLSPKNPFSGAIDFFALSVDPQGAYQWHTFYGMQSGYFTIYDMQIDAVGNIYLAGRANNLFTGIQPQRALVSPGQYDVLLMKLSSAGAMQWYTFFGSSDRDEGSALAFSGSDIVITGQSSGDWPGMNPLHPLARDTDNLFVMKLTSSGVYQWHTFYGPAVGVGLAVDSRGFLYVVGSAGDIGMNPSTPHRQNRDALLMALTLQGQYVSHAYYGTGEIGSLADALDVILLDGNTAYLLGETVFGWPDHAALHNSPNMDNIVLAKISMVEQPTSATTTSLALPPSPVEAGHPITFTASMASSGGTPFGGSVTFKDGATVLGSAEQVTGKASLGLTLTVPGSHAITAQYSGAPGFLPSQTSQSTTLQVVKAKTAVVLHPTSPYFDYGKEASFDISVVPVNENTQVPAGEVVLKDGTRIIGSALLTNGKASMKIGGLPAGIMAVTATYQGSAIFASGVSPVSNVIISKAYTYATLQVLPATTISYGSDLTLKTTVTSYINMATLPDGAVSVQDNNQAIGSLALASGSALFTTHSLALGPHTLTVTYTGSDNFHPSQPVSKTIEVTQGTPRILLTTEGRGAVNSGETRRILISVQGPYPDLLQPTGSVTLMEGENPIATLSLVDGSAASEPLALSDGSHLFTATYSGDTLYKLGTSPLLVVVVAGIPTYLPLVLR